MRRKKHEDDIFHDAEVLRLNSATHQKTPTQNMKERENNTDDRKRKGQHKRQAQIWTDMDKTDKRVFIAPASGPQAS